MMVGYHGHTDVTNPEHFGAPESWETAMSYSPYNGINLDFGHFVAANNFPRRVSHQVPRQGNARPREGSQNERRPRTCRSAKATYRS